MNSQKIRADFNELFGDILCLSHADTCVDGKGAVIKLCAGMVVTAFDEDADENGLRDNLIASGVVEPALNWLQAHGSRWVLKIDGNGVRHESEIEKDA